MEEYDIFISYRRVGGADFARQMQLALKTIGYKVFLDFDELKDGVFDRRIEMAINHSKVFLFVLSPHALDRCKNEDDWVRREIECALISKCHIVPVSPNVTFEGFDDIEGLPYFIKNGLGQHQVSTVMMNDLFECTFEEFVRKRIANVVSPHQQALKDEVKEGCEVHIETDIPCYVFRFKERLIIAQPNDDNLIYLKKGSHKLTFMSTENEDDSYSLVYAVKDDCEFLQVNLAKIRDVRVAAEEAERLVKKEEAERRAKEEAERRAKEEAERLAKEEETKRIAEDDTKYQRYEENYLFGFKIDNTIVIPAKYAGIRSFSEGLAAVELYGKWGFIDKRGKEVIPLKYKSALSFCERLAAVKVGSKYGFIDNRGRLVIPSKYDYADSFSEGLAKVKLGSKYGFVDKSGKVVIPLKYDSAGSFREGLAAVRLGSKYGFINKSGKEVIPLKYDSAYSFSDGLTAIELNGKWGYLDKNGKEVISLEYDSAGSFRDGLAAVKLCGNYGFVDKNGKIVIPLKYDYVYYFSNGQARAKLNGEWGYIDKQGNFNPNK